MNVSDNRLFARFILLGLILMGIGFDVAALSAPPLPVHVSRLVCVTPNIAPEALCPLLVRQ